MDILEDYKRQLEEMEDEEEEEEEEADDELDLGDINSQEKEINKLREILGAEDEPLQSLKVTEEAEVPLDDSKEIIKL